MTLEEEIMKLDLIASDAFEGGDADEFRQLAEWLRELKMYKDLEAQGYAMYNVSEVMHNDDKRNHRKIQTYHFARTRCRTKKVKSHS